MPISIRRRLVTFTLLLLALTGCAQKREPEQQIMSGVVERIEYREPTHNALDSTIIYFQDGSQTLFRGSTNHTFRIGVINNITYGKRYIGLTHDRHYRFIISVEFE